MSQGNFFKINRRLFLGQSVGSILSLGGLSAFLQSCSTLDEYLIEDQFDFDQEVVIVGGGLTGLFAAYELKKNKIPFKIFEASTRFGGQLQTIDQVEWGASQFKKNDTLLLATARELNLDIQYHDKTTWSFKAGSSAFIGELMELIQGIMPRRQIRKDHRLVSIRRFGTRYQLNFQTAGKDKAYYAKKILIALPTFSLKNIKGLDQISLDMQGVHHIPLNAVQRLIIPMDIIEPSYKLSGRLNSKKLEGEFAGYALQLNKDLYSNATAFEMNGICYFTIHSSSGHPLRQIHTLQNFVDKITRSTYTLGPDYLKDWGEIEVPQTLVTQKLGFGLEVKMNSSVSMLPSSSMVQVVTDAMLNFEPQMSEATASLSTAEKLIRLTRSRVDVFKADL